MIIVDDRLSLDALAGRRERFAATSVDTVATTWSFHFRLVRALTDTSRVGALTDPEQGSALLEAASAAPAHQLQVLDPRELTATAAMLAVRHGLNLLAAELVAAATHHAATVALSSSNVGRTWPHVFEIEGIDLRLVD